MSVVLPSSSRGDAMPTSARRFGSLAAIIVLHIGFFYAIQSGLLQQAAQALPQEVFASFIVPESALKIEVLKSRAPATVPTAVPKKAAPAKAPLSVNDKPVPSVAPDTPTAPAAPAESKPAAAAQSGGLSKIGFITESEKK